MSDSIIQKVFQDETIKDIPVLTVITIISAVIRAEIEVEDERTNA